MKPLILVFPKLYVLLLQVVCSIARWQGAVIFRRKKKSQALLHASVPGCKLLTSPAGACLLKGAQLNYSRWLLLVLEDSHSQHKLLVWCQRDASALLVFLLATNFSLLGCFHSQCTSMALVPLTSWSSWLNPCVIFTASYNSLSRPSFLVFPATYLVSGFL